MFFSYILLNCLLIKAVVSRPGVIHKVLEYILYRQMQLKYNAVLTSFERKLSLL